MMIDEATRQVMVWCLNIIIFGILGLEVYKMRQKGLEIEEFIQLYPQKAMIYAAVIIFWVVLTITQSPRTEVVYAYQNIRNITPNNSFNITAWMVK